VLKHENTKISNIFSSCLQYMLSFTTVSGLSINDCYSNRFKNFVIILIIRKFSEFSIVALPTSRSERAGKFSYYSIKDGAFLIIFQVTLLVDPSKSW
jgi:hypothetical protein